MKKRIFLLSDAKNPHTIKWARSLALAGHDIFVYGITPFESDIYKNYPNIQSAHSGLSEKYNKIGDGAFQKICYLTTLFHLKRKIKEFNPDILHAHYATSYGLLGLLSRFRPFYISVWGADVYDFPQRSFIHRWLLKLNLWAADRLFSTSHVMALETLKYTSKDIEVIPFGVDLEKFKPLKVSSHIFPEGSLIVGTIKSLEDKYGIDYLIDAFSIVKKRNPTLPLKLLIVGRGTKEQILKNKVKELGLEKDTIFTGFIPVEDVPTYQNMLDIAVFPSVLDSESFGVSVVEACACGKPVIVSDKGGLPEVVKKGESGLVVPASDAMALADAIQRLIDDPELRKKMGAQGRSRVQSLYDWNVNLSAMVAAYEKQ